MPTLAGWADYLTNAQMDHLRHRREQTFQYPSLEQVVHTLSHGRPANAADLQALLCDHLRLLAEEFRHGPTDGYKMFWNVDQYGRPVNPIPENDCRDRLLEHLRPRVMPLGVAPESEGHYADDNRADIKALAGRLNIPVEIKRHYHTELWTAPLQQFKQLYVRDPGTEDRGIYLVLWFGNVYKPVPVPPAGITRPQTAAQLEQALHQAIPEREHRLLNIIVIDCSKPV